MREGCINKTFEVKCYMKEYKVHVKEYEVHAKELMMNK
jgi:hypothetical protein